MLYYASISVLSLYRFSFHFPSFILLSIILISLFSRAGSPAFAAAAAASIECESDIVAGLIGPAALAMRDARDAARDDEDDDDGSSDDDD